jgi:uncharacterized repeat protein (TIGR02543 family)
MASGDLGVTAEWDLVTYTITYNNSGTNSPKNPATYNVNTDSITLEAPTNEGAVFGGWYDNAEFTGEPVKYIYSGSTGDKVLYAKWDVPTYRITYATNHGRITNDKPVTYTALTDTITLVVPTRTFFKFTGWFDNAELSGTPVATIEKGSSGDKNLYAGWELSELMLALDFVKFEKGVLPQWEAADQKSFNNTISAYEIGKYELTKEVWHKIREWAVSDDPYNKYTFENDGTAMSPTATEDGKVPIGNISWYDAIAWCNAYSEAMGLTPCYTMKEDGVYNVYRDSTKRPGQWEQVACDWKANGYRLQTSGEWEKAARFKKNGTWTDGSFVSGASDLSWHLEETNKYAWNENNASTLQPVGGKLPNEAECYDMSGNAEEWCWDWFHYPTPTGNQTDYRGPSGNFNTYRVRRGGSVSQPVAYLSVDHTEASSMKPEGKGAYTGLRIARSVVTQ